MGKYTADDIMNLKFFDAIRKYPGMYIGSKDIDGLHHLLKEVISNSIDEYLNTTICNNITVRLLADGSVKVTDNGRGIPIGKPKGQKETALEVCFTKQHAGGKFKNDDSESGYNSTGGMHGIGTKCVNALSDKLFVTSWREGKTESISFEDGAIVKHETVSCDKELHGLEVWFYPSAKYLETNEFDSNRVETMLREFSFLCSGLKFVFIDEKNKKEVEYYSDNGLYDYATYLNGKNKFIFEPLYFSKQTGNFQVEVIFGYNDSYTSNIKLYTNNIPQEKGTHLTGFKTALTSTLNQFARDKKLLKEKDENLTGSDFEEGQVLVLNFKMIDPVFKGQNKEELSSSEGRVVVQQLTSAAINEFCVTNESDIREIINKALAARKAREASKKAEKAAREVKPREKSLKNKLAISDKFTDCSSKNPSERNLLIVEGLSASGSVIEARNVKTDCVYQLKGKILNVLKATETKALENTEISDLIKIIGAGYKDKFNLEKMDYDKIIITTDQDADGMDIELLLIAFFFTYMRPLVEAGKLYRAMTPLYIITYKKNKYYMYTEEELAKWQEDHKGETYDLAHLKGLGETSAAVLKETCFDPQNYKRITVEDVNEAARLIEVFQGEAVAPRKQYIYDNATDFGFNFI